MTTVPFNLLAIIAAIFAATCVIGGMAGCLAVLAFGILCFLIAAKDSSTPEYSQVKPFSSFWRWGAAVLMFDGFALLLAPFQPLPAVVVGVLLLSPLFGTWVYIAASAMASLSTRTPP